MFLKYAKTSFRLPYVSKMENIGTYNRMGSVIIHIMKRYDRLIFNHRETAVVIV